MQKKWFLRGIILFLVLVFLGGCTTMNMNVNALDHNGRPINGATVTVDGMYIGQTPYARTKVSYSSAPTIKVEASGYETVTVIAKRRFSLGRFLFVNMFYPVQPRKNQDVILTPVH